MQWFKDALFNFYTLKTGFRNVFAGESAFTMFIFRALTAWKRPAAENLNWPSLTLQNYVTRYQTDANKPAALRDTFF